MQKIYGLLMGLMLLASFSLVLAQDNTSVSNESLLISPAPSMSDEEVEVELGMNESASSGAILGQQLRVWFTFNKENKIDAELKLAKLRLIQANIAAKNNNSVAMQKALEAHEKIMAKVQEHLSKLDGSNRFEELNVTAFKLVGLQRAIQVHERRINRIETRLNDSNLSDQEREVLEMQLEQARNNTAHLVTVSDAKKEEIKTRIMATRNLSEEEAGNIVEQRVQVKEQKGK